MTPDAGRVPARFIPEDYLDRVFSEHGADVQMCGDCVHFQRCQVLVQALSYWTECDWTPSRFVSNLTMRPRTDADAGGGHVD